MQDYIYMLGLASFPFLGNLAGGLIAEFLGVNERLRSMALHAASGLIIAIIGVELMPRIVKAQPAWPVIVAFILGGMTAVLVDKLIDRYQDSKHDSSSKGAAMIYFAVSVDLFSDGVLIGTGSTIARDLALVLAIGQVTADIPEGFASIATFKDKGFSRNRRILLSLGFAIPVFVGATIGYWLVRGQADWVKLALLSFTAAILARASVEEIMEKAHSGNQESSWNQMGFILGFALFLSFSIYFNSSESG